MAFLDAIDCESSRTRDDMTIFADGTDVFAPRPARGRPPPRSSSAPRASSALHEHLAALERPQPVRDVRAHLRGGKPRGARRRRRERLRDRDRPGFAAAVAAGGGGGEEPRCCCCCCFFRCWRRGPGAGVGLALAHRRHRRLGGRRRRRLRELEPLGRSAVPADDVRLRQFFERAARRPARASSTLTAPSTCCSPACTRCTPRATSTKRSSACTRRSASTRAAATTSRSARRHERALCVLALAHRRGHPRRATDRLVRPSGR